MQIEPRKGIVVVKKYDDKSVSDVMVITENEDDKNLFTCQVVQGTDDYETGDIVVVGRYSLYKLMFSGEEVYFLETEDIISKIKKDV